MGQVCGTSNATVNSVRRAAEKKVQASPAMKSAVENLQSHSGKVGLQHYDKSGESVRASFINQLSAKDSPLKDIMDIPEEVKKKRKRMMEKEREDILKEAKETLGRQKLQKKLVLSKTCKLRPVDRMFLQNFFATVALKDFSSKTVFPGKF